MTQPYFGRDRNGVKVTGAREDAVLKASGAQIKANRDAMNSTGVMDINRDMDKVRKACWDALDKYDLDNPVG